MEDNVAWKRVLLMGEADDDGGQLYASRHHLQAQKYKLIIYIPPENRSLRRKRLKNLAV